MVSTISNSVFSKKKKCEDLESSQESTGEDQKVSKTPEQDAEVPFVQANWFILRISTLFGFHNIREGSCGALEVSPWRMVPLLVHLGISVAGFLALINVTFFGNLEYHQTVMISPMAYGMVFCIDAYISSFHLGKHYVTYFSTIQHQDVKTEYFSKMICIGVGTVVSSIVYTACNLLVTNLSQGYFFVLVIPVFTTTYLPTVMDMQMFAFNHMLKQQVVRLRHRLQRVNHWTRAEVAGVARQWLLLCRLFRLHNRVSPPLFPSLQ